MDKVLSEHIKSSVKLNSGMANSGLGIQAYRKGELEFMKDEMPYIFYITGNEFFTGSLRIREAF